MSDKFVNRQKNNKKGKGCLVDYTKEKASNLSAMEYVKNGRQGDYLACDTYGTPKQVGTAVDIKGYDIIKRVYSPDGKSPALTTMQGGHRQPKVIVKSMTEVRTPEANKIRREHIKKTGKDWSPRHMRHLVERDDEKSNTITASMSKQHIIQLTRDTDQDVHWRKLTPLECERLQTVDDNYTEGVSNSQRYKMLGNGWTIDVICHILNHIK